MWQDFILLMVVSFEKENFYFDEVQFVIFLLSNTPCFL